MSKDVCDPLSKRPGFVNGNLGQWVTLAIFLLGLFGTFIATSEKTKTNREIIDSCKATHNADVAELKATQRIMWENIASTRDSVNQIIGRLDASRSGPQ